MKQFILTIMLNTMVQIGYPQGVGLVMPPHASALLDLGTTGKGLLLPRLTTIQRLNLPIDVQALMVYDTDTKSTWFFQGASWTNLNNYGLSLPSSWPANFNVDAFSISNAGIGAAIKGISTTDNGYGIAGVSQSAYGYGVYGTAMGANAIGVYASTTDATGIKAVATTGIAVDAASQANIAIKTGIPLAANANSVILANHPGSGAGVDATSVSGYGIKALTSTSSSNGAAVYAFNVGTHGSGVLGIANFATGYGVQGSSTTGTGVYGYTNTGRSIMSSTINGSGLYGFSNFGYSLETAGKLKISGGNTNPAIDKVLRSDASGNATWQPLPKIAFRVSGINGSGSQYIPDEKFVKFDFVSEDFDNGASFNLGNNTFGVPVNGVYRFDFTTQFTGDQIYSTNWVTAYLKLDRNGTISTLAAEPGIRSHGFSNGLGGEYDVANLQLSGAFRLLAGDKIWMEIYHSTGYEAKVATSQRRTYFSGHWVSN